MHFYSFLFLPASSLFPEKLFYPVKKLKISIYFLLKQIILCYNLYITEYIALFSLNRLCIQRLIGGMVYES